MRWFSGWMMATLLLGCDAQPLATSGEVAPETASQDVASVFTAAAEAYDVPEALLLAIAHAETGLQMVQGAEEFPGRPRAFGVMGLREHVLAEAAGLAGVDVGDAQTVLSANVAAAAALLSAQADVLGIAREDLDAWAPVVAAYSDIDDADAQAAYVHREVYGVFSRGVALEGVRIPRIEVSPAWAQPLELPEDGVLGIGDAGAIWTPSPNYNSRNGAEADFVIIHTCEGTYSGCWGWLTNSSAGVSAHYVVNDNGSEVRQLVDEANRAWHIGASYDCANNFGEACWRNGTSMNTVSVGIEHAGFASQTSWNTTMLQRSAELTCGITQRHGIVRDAYHIVGHGQLQPANRTDPGANWPWSDYLQRIATACGDTTGGPTTGTAYTIDSNDAANIPGVTEMTVSANWTSSANVAGYYNTGYWVAQTEAVSDPARFRVNLSADTCYEVQAWWTSAADRAPSAPFIWYDSSGAELGRANVDQRALGGQWNTLGYGIFTPGWNQVILSRWTTLGAWVVADAVRLVPSNDCPGWTGGDPDSDGDGTPDSLDGCVDDPDKTDPGTCGCGVVDEDITGDGVADCTVCGDGVIEAPETCDDGARVGGDGCSEMCATEALIMDPVAPGVAGMANTLSSRQGTPGSTTWYILGWRAGWTQVPGCPGQFVPIRSPLVLGGAVSNAAGFAGKTSMVPMSAVGVDFTLYAVELDTCRVSPPVSARF